MRSSVTPFPPEHRRQGSVRASVDGILATVGQTPLVRLRRQYAEHDIDVWAKLESFNPTGSAKDRPAVRMLQDAIALGEAGPGTTVIESSSGNLGVALARACRFHGMRFICVVDSRAPSISVETIRALGASVHVVTEPDPATGDLLVARLALVAQLLERTPGAFWPDQYANPENPGAHAVGTMREIDEALDGAIDVVLVATSTAGTIAGCCDFLRANGRSTRVIAVDAVGSALFGGTRGPRKLPGFGAGIETPLSRSVRHDHVVRVTDLDCVVGCRRLVAREAIFAGASAGGVAVALAGLAPTLAPGTRCAIILHDGGTGYLRTVYDDAWVEAELGCGADELAARVKSLQSPASDA